MNDIIQDMKEYFTQTFEQYGPNVQGVDWGGPNDEPKLRMRYDKMLSVIQNCYNKPEKITLLDVGCGYGGLYEYAKSKGVEFDYTGIDICENMISYAKENNPYAVFICDDFLKHQFDEKYSFVICNGILTEKLSASILDMDKYARTIIHKMYSLCECGVAFNIMTSQVDFTNNILYYKSPLEILAYCMTLTEKFVLDSSYPLYEYTTMLYKK